MLTIAFKEIEVKLADIMGRNRRNGQMSNGPAGRCCHRCN